MNSISEWKNRTRLERAFRQQSRSIVRTFHESKGLHYEQLETGQIVRSGRHAPSKKAKS